MRLLEGKKTNGCKKVKQNEFFEFRECFREFPAHIVLLCSHHAVPNRINRLELYVSGLLGAIRVYLAHFEPHFEPRFLAWLLLASILLPAAAQTAAFSDAPHTCHRC
jgi:hypothetical protein